MSPELALLLNAGLIFLARIVDVSLSTVRIMLVVRGQRLLAAAIGFCEIAVWLTAASRVLQSVHEPVQFLAYCGGFAAGVYVGQRVEERMALGIAAVQVIPHRGEVAEALADALREAGYGVTVLTGEGRSGPRKVLLVTARRKGIPQLIGTARAFDPEAFVTVLEARHALGGTMRLGR